MRPHSRSLCATSARRDMRGAAIDRVRLTVLLIVMLAFVWQAFVTRSHVHVETMPVAVTRAAVKAELLNHYADWPVLEKAEPSCAICQDAAATDHHLPGSPVTFEATSAAVYTIYAVAAQIARVGHIAPGWNSRAPPQG